MERGKSSLKKSCDESLNSENPAFMQASKVRRETAVKHHF